MAREWKTRTFKSGNSVALRLPKALGVMEGEEFAIVPHASGRFSVWPEQDGLKVLMSLYGAFSPGFMSEGRGDIEQDDYDWSPAQRPAKAA